MSNLKCPFCQQELNQDNPQIIECRNDDCKKSYFMYGSKELWLELIKLMEDKDLSDKIGKLETELDRTRKALEQSEICCTEWEKQALDYKAENIALSGDLERTRKALDGAKWWLHEIVESHRYTPISTAEMALKEITALEQKD